MEFKRTGPQSVQTMPRLSQLSGLRGREAQRKRGGERPGEEGLECAKAERQSHEQDSRRAGNTSGMMGTETQREKGPLATRRLHFGDCWDRV